MEWSRSGYEEEGLTSMNLSPEEVRKILQDRKTSKGQ